MKMNEIELRKNLYLAFLSGYWQYYEAVSERFNIKEKKLRVWFKEYRDKSFFVVDLINDENRKIGEFVEKVKNAYKYISFVDYTPNLLVLETDLPTKAENEKVAEKISDILKQLNISHFVVYSGNKSFHIWIFYRNLFRVPSLEIKKLEMFNQIIYAIKSEEYVRILTKTIEEKIGIKLDPIVISPGFHIRVPYSYHQKTWLPSRILYVWLAYLPDKINIEEKIREMKQEELENFFYNLFFDIERENKIVLDAIKLDLEEIKKKFFSKKKQVKKKGRLRKILEAFYNELLRTQIKDGRDAVFMILFTIAKYLGKSREEFEADLEIWNDFSDWKRSDKKPVIKYFIENYENKEYSWKWALRYFKTLGEGQGTIKVKTKDGEMMVKEVDSPIIMESEFKKIWNLVKAYGLDKYIE